MKISKGVIAFLMAAALTSAALTIPAGFSQSVYAQEISYSDADMVYAPEDITSASDVVTPTDHINAYPFKEIKVDYFRLSMLVPELEQNFSAAETNAQLHEKLYDQFGISSREDIINYADYYGGNSCYLYNGNSANGDITVMVMYNENEYTRFIGDYTGMSEEEIDDICSAADFQSSGDPVVPMKINGRTFLCQRCDVADYGTSTYVLETIVNGGKYTVYVDLASPSEFDADKVDLMFQSIKVKGVRRENYNVASSTFATILAVCCGLLAALVALLGFFIYRFNAFAKAAGSSFSVIGFNMPPKDEQKKK